MTTFKPILFSTAMVQALLEGKKTQTRRIVKLPVIENANWGGGAYIEHKSGERTALDYHGNLPSKYKRGDILWVRETFGIDFLSTAGNKYCYKSAGDKKPVDGWKPSIFMPKEACRILLEVTKVRVERLQDISEADAKAEGIKKTWISDHEQLCKWKNYVNDGRGSLYPRESFQSLWHSINGEASWKENPWVWVYHCKKVEKPEGFLVTSESKTAN